MFRSVNRSLATRVAGVLLLAAGMLVSPSIAQVSAAERCRTACAAEPSAAPACCTHLGDGQQVTLRQDAGHRDSEPSDSDTKYCPGCNGRPLILTSDRLTLTLEPAPVAAPATDADSSVSFDVPFAIFHPPRA
jgi:hypothetical protein